MNHEFSPINIKEDEFYKRFRGFVETKYGSQQLHETEEHTSSNPSDSILQPTLIAQAPAERVLMYSQ